MSRVASNTTADAPYLVALNLTQRCNLACAHCYLDATHLKDGGKDELCTTDLKRVLGEIAAVGPEAMVVLTGGEPTLRPDLTALVEHASALGLMVVLGTNGMSLTPVRIKVLQQAGLAGMGISVDSLDPERHDTFRGASGAWARTMAGIDACKDAQMPFQIHFCVTEETAGEIDNMIAFARESGAMVLNVFFMVCTGRGEKYSGISAEKYDTVLRRVAHAARAEQRLMVRAKCAPHFKRIAMEMDPDWPITAAHGYDSGGCIAAKRYARVTPSGEVTPCPYMDNSAGSLMEQSFQQIWENAPVLKALRTPDLEGRCGICEFQKLCGGCRARPLAAGGNMMGEDSLCSYQPKGGKVIAPLKREQEAMKWSREAEDKIARVPAFVRRMVRQRAEGFVREQGRAEVTSADLTLLAKRRFGEAGPPAFARNQRRRG
ncbi:MAG: radical SAM protein [Alphaproteobacteria bacterium]|nr:radical SAM protein [Alphaproteobacteria bacterium]